MHNTVVKAGFDLSAFGTLAAWWAGVAPGVATTLTALWVTYCFLDVGYIWFKKFKNRSKKKNGLRR